MSDKFCVHSEMKRELLARQSALNAERLGLLKAASRLAAIDAALSEIQVELDRAEQCISAKNAPQFVETNEE